MFSRDRISAVLCAAFCAFFGVPEVCGQAVAPPSLKTLPVPEPPNLSDFVRNRSAAIALGKALFWDMQVGSDGVTACATCHFHAGADSRSKNQISPGLKRVFFPSFLPNPDLVFTKGPNATLAAADFPLRKLADPNNRASAVLADSNDVVSSQGVFHRIFVSAGAGTVDQSYSAPDPDGFMVGALNVRRVEPRNTPSVFNAVFFFRSFWDGRAQNDFNGVNIHGARDPQAVVYVSDPGQPKPVQVSLIHSSLASQAVGPPVNSFEMSADGRSFPEVGDKFTRRFRLRARRLAGGRPLANQSVHPQDSVLGPLSRWPLPGLSPLSYDAMIRAAFHSKWWSAPLWMIRENLDGSRSAVPVRLPMRDNEYALIEYNFSLFFGIAVQMYESTLISNDAPFDRFAEGQTAALTAQQQQGLQLFLNNGCIFCHSGPEFSDATVRRVGVNRLRRRSGQLIDAGFANIGVRPTLEDAAVGATDGTAANRPLSEARLAMLGLFNDPTLSPPLSPADVVATDGAFKIPSLRNVELTAPYFHNGGQATLRGVIDFYNRGGDFVPIETRDGVPIAPLNTLALSDADKAALEAFLRSLTDERVRYRRAPFDHPQLFVPNGQSASAGLPGQLADIMVPIPAVGRNGGPALPNFLGLP
jgi:cytochrome c peroxidase